LNHFAIDKLTGPPAGGLIIDHSTLILDNALWIRYHLFAAPIIIENNMEHLIAKTKDKAKSLITLIGYEADPIVTFKDNVIFVNIEIDSPALLIGKGGEGLDALQHILRTMLGRDMAEERKVIVIDISGYRDKKSEATERFAREKALTVLATGIPEELLPMSSYERRVVHMIVSSIADVETESVGEGKDRRVVIKPKKQS
jgi:spoIIIJ-associated protein